VTFAWNVHPERWVLYSEGAGASARASIARNPLPEIVLSAPLTAAEEPRALTPKTVARVTTFLSS
jgi:hypothetical protein